MVIKTGCGIPGLQTDGTVEMFQILLKRFRGPSGQTYVPCAIFQKWLKGPKLGPLEMKCYFKVLEFLLYVHGVRGPVGLPKTHSAPLSLPSEQTKGELGIQTTGCPAIHPTPRTPFPVPGALAPIPSTSLLEGEKKREGTGDLRLESMQ